MISQFHPTLEMEGELGWFIKLEDSTINNLGLMV